MIYKKRKMTIPQYREKKELFELFGYKEESYEEKGIYAYVTLSIDENSKNYASLRKLENQIYRKGPPFFPIILFVAVAFILLSFFVIYLAISIKDKTPFDLVSYSFGFLFPAFACLLGCVIYTYFYFSINRRLVEKGQLTKEQIIDLVNNFKNK